MAPDAHRSEQRGRATASLRSHPHDRGRLGSTRSQRPPDAHGRDRQTTGAASASRGRGRRASVRPIAMSSLVRLPRARANERGGPEENLEPPGSRAGRSPVVAHESLGWGSTFAQHVRDLIAEGVGHPALRGARAREGHRQGWARDRPSQPVVSSWHPGRSGGTLPSLQGDGALVAQVAVVPAEDALDVAASLFVGRDPVVAHHRALARVVGGDGEDEIAVEGVC